MLFDLIGTFYFLAPRTNRINQWLKNWTTGYWSDQNIDLMRVPNVRLALEFAIPQATYLGAEPCRRTGHASSPIASLRTMPARYAAARSPITALAVNSLPQRSAALLRARCPPHEYGPTPRGSRQPAQRLPLDERPLLTHR